MEKNITQTKEQNRGGLGMRLGTYTAAGRGKAGWRTSLLLWYPAPTLQLPTSPQPICMVYLYVPSAGDDLVTCPDPHLREEPSPLGEGVGTKLVMIM